MVGGVRASGFQLFCLLMLTIAVLALATLLYTIINDSFGLTAVVNQNDPEEVVATLGYDPATTHLGRSLLRRAGRPARGQRLQRGREETGTGTAVL